MLATLLHKDPFFFRTEPFPMNSSTTMVRRGKPSARPEVTVLVEKNAVNGTTGGSSSSNNGLALVPVIGVAQVKRNYCGTGPFDKHWFNYDCCGIVCALLTYVLHAYGVFCVCFIVIPPWMSEYYEDVTGMEGQKVRFLTTSGRTVTTMFCFLAFMACAAHFKAMTTDPGAVPPDARPIPEEDDDLLQQQQQQSSLESADNRDATKTSGNIDDGMPTNPAPVPSLESLHAESLTTPSKTRRLCRRCKAFKPQRAHHCSVCRRCIIKMDHHCPWVNNCVGIGNHKYFLLFCFYTFLTCLMSLVLVVIRFSTCVSSHHHGHRHSQLEQAADAMEASASSRPCLDRPPDLLLVLFLLIESLLFGMFTSCMMADQLEVVHSKLTHIDRLKGVQVGGNLQGVSEVFGVARHTSRAREGRFRPDWLSPFHRVCFPDNVHDQVMGFCRPILNNLGCAKEAELAVGSTTTVDGSGLRHLSDLV